MKKFEKTNAMIHNHEVAGSIPALATQENQVFTRLPDEKSGSFFFD